VPAVSLATALEQACDFSGHERVRLLKLDCEGSEYAQLFTTELTRVDELVAETHDLGAEPIEIFRVGQTPLTGEALVARLEAQGFEAQIVPHPHSEVNAWLFARRPQAGRRKPARVMFCRFPYGNQEAPDVTDWLIQTAVQTERDPRISDTFFVKIDDTPITMCRNIAAQQALDQGIDLLVMVDNDMRPDLGLVGKFLIPGAKAFWQSSFDFWWEHQGPCLVGAPYCGPPPHNNVFVFLWRNRQNQPQDPEFSLKQYEREEASLLTGIQPVAALPTGLILCDTEVFRRLNPPWFYYEFPDARTQKKLSTEDVTFTRDAQLHGVPIYCNWDSWAGHWKRYLVGKPRPLGLGEIPWKFRQMCQAGLSHGQDLRQEGPHEPHRVV
jgi:hypothetical protein